jgi:hypothetical protein
MEVKRGDGDDWAVNNFQPQTSNFQTNDKSQLPNPKHSNAKSISDFDTKLPKNTKGTKGCSGSRSEVLAHRSMNYFT